MLSCKLSILPTGRKVAVFMKPTQYGALPVPDQNALVEHRVRELGEAPSKLSSVFWF